MLCARYMGAALAQQQIKVWTEGRNERVLARLLLVQSTGVEFPEVTTLWDGDKMRSVGAGVRAKRFGFIPVKVHSQHRILQEPLTALQPKIHLQKAAA